MSGIIIGATPTVWVPISFTLTVDGKPVTIKFEAEYERMTRKLARKRMKQHMERFRRIAVLGDRHKALSDSEDDSAVRQEIEAELDALDQSFDDEIRGNLKGWRNLNGADGEPLPFGDAALDEMMDHPEYYTALRDSLMRATGQVVEESEKNSSASVAG